MFFSVIRTIMAGQPVDLWQVTAQVLAIVFVILCILPLHEYAHGWVAGKLGDPTARLERRLTLNPLASVDPVGTVWLFLFGFGWAKPVPVDPRYFKKPKRDMAIVALAGPVSNLLAGLAGAVVMQAMRAFLTGGGVNAVTQFIYAVLNFYVLVNIGLAALLFALFRALSNVYTGIGLLDALNLPSTVYNMFPYIISLVVLVFVSKKSRAPKAEGIPYDKGQR